METIQQAKDYLRENWEDGAKCPCCNQTVKLYKRKLNSSMALGLIMISLKHNGVNTSNWFHLENYFKDLPVHSTVRGDIPKLRHWGLIESFNRIRKILNGKIVDKKSPVVCPRCLWLSKSYRHCENCGKHINTKEVE